ncbi:MAG: hypothetical protein ACRDZO_28500, partial [Egibacteraceae bacterium]
MANASRPASATTTRGPRGTLRHRLAPVIGLILLSPLVGEFLLGNISIDQIAGVLLFAPLYGGGALLVREVARRAGRGWPTMILLALAYSVPEEGLVTQLLFNPSYYGQDFLSAAYIPALGVGASVTLAVLALHTIWSISVPIALVETFVPDRRTTPWLGKIGLAVTGAVFTATAALFFYGSYTEERFLASAPQLIGTAVVIVALITGAFVIGRRPRPHAPAQVAAPDPRLVGAVSLALSSTFLAPLPLPEWVGVGTGLALVVLAAVLVTRGSRREGWGAAHRLALAGGALLT